MAESKRAPEDCTLFNDNNRNAVRALVDARVWVAIGKFSGGLLGGFVFLCGLVFYTYNQGENYTNEKIKILIMHSTDQQAFNTKMLRSLDELKYKMHSDIVANAAAIEAEKKNREHDIMDIKRLISSLGNN